VLGQPIQANCFRTELIIPIEFSMTFCFCLAELATSSYAQAPATQAKGKMNNHLRDLNIVIRFNPIRVDGDFW
jgi:hypothetical protein